MPVLNVVVARVSMYKLTSMDYNRLMVFGEEASFLRQQITKEDRQNQQNVIIYEWLVEKIKDIEAKK